MAHHYQPMTETTSPWIDAYVAEPADHAAMAMATRHHQASEKAPEQAESDEQQPTHDALADIYNRSSDDEMRKRV